MISVAPVLHSSRASSSIGFVPTFRWSATQHNLQGVCILGGFRSAIKRGGGFLNNVDGELKDYRFEARFKGEKKDGDNLYFVPEIQVDGADEPVDQHLYLGASERYEISEDGKSLTMVDESPVTFGYSIPFGLFMETLIDAAEKAEGVEKGESELEASLPNLADGEALNLEALIGRRFRFKQEIDEKANEKFGKRKGKGKNAPKDGYNRTNTVIDAVLGGKAGKASKTSKPAAGGKKTKVSDEDAMDTEAQDVLKDVLAKGDVNRKNLSLPITKALLKNDNGPALKKIILDEEWQDEQDWLTVDKKGNLSVE